MKAKLFISAFVALFIIGMNTSLVKAESMVYSNTEKDDNAVATTYFKGNSVYENLAPFKKKVKIHDERGTCVSKITYLWDSKKNRWAPSEKLDYSYENDQLMGVKHAEWNKETMTWKNLETMEYSYDSEGEILGVEHL